MKNNKLLKSISFDNVVMFVIVFVNIIFLFLSIFSQSFRDSLPQHDNSASCRWEQDCDF